MGLLIWPADILGFALFQLMQVRPRHHRRCVHADSVMMLTFVLLHGPAVGIAMAGTTLVGQAIGAHRHDWAFKVGNRIILMAVAVHWARSALPARPANLGAVGTAVFLPISRRSTGR